MSEIKIAVILVMEDGQVIEKVLPRNFETLGHANVCIDMAQEYWHDWKFGNTDEIRNWGIDVLFNTGMLEFGESECTAKTARWRLK